MKTLTTKEKKKFWNKIVRKTFSRKDRNKMPKDIQDFIFNTIVNAPVMPDIKPLDEE